MLVCVYVCNIYFCMSECMYVRIYICGLCARLYVCTYVSMHVCIYVSMYPCTYISINMRLCMCLLKYVFIYL